MMAAPRTPGIPLSELLAGFATRDPLPSIVIQDIASNSAAVTVNSAFIALPGIRSNGID